MRHRVMVDGARFEVPKKEFEALLTQFQNGRLSYRELKDGLYLSSIPDSAANVDGLYLDIDEMELRRREEPVVVGNYYGYIRMHEIGRTA
ncbi:MAG: hypothetical protein HY513_04175 [Candidatus Aenigmarchaeota archaeon]|nr:hypothetical protein [Candidatus Aenigmarchaeota archaeon]